MNKKQYEGRIKQLENDLQQAMKQGYVPGYNPPKNKFVKVLAIVVFLALVGALIYMKVNPGFIESAKAMMPQAAP